MTNALSLRRSTAAVLAACLLAMAPTAHAAGEPVFAPCAACHSIDGSDGPGPSLLGIDGRPAASVAGFRYSRALQRAGIVWTAATLDGFLADPQRAVPGNVMPFPGIVDDAQRAAVVSYLLTLTQPPRR